MRHLLMSSSCDSISVVSRNPTTNCLPGVNYQAGDIANLSSIRSVILQICPSVIIHAACPNATSATARAFHQVTVQGTQNLLQVAHEAPSVRVFIFTSSATMAAGPEHIDLDESTPLADSDPNSHPYARTKAQADKMVLNANKPISEEGAEGLLTACIRLPIVYGEVRISQSQGPNHGRCYKSLMLIRKYLQRDLLSIPGALAALEKNQTNFQLGDGSNMWDFVSADNVAEAHSLLAKALMRSAVTREKMAPKVDGEAFNITDGQRHRFWDFPRVVWKAAGWEPPPDEAKKIFILPTRLAIVIATVLEWVYWVGTLGTRRPGLLSKQQVWISCYTHTYRIEKAKERLGYAPVPEFEAGIQRAVAWSLDEGGWGPRLQKTTSCLEKPKTKTRL